MRCTNPRRAPGSRSTMSPRTLAHRGRPLRRAEPVRAHVGAPRHGPPSDPRTSRASPIQGLRRRGRPRESIGQLRRRREEPERRALGAAAETARTRAPKTRRAPACRADRRAEGPAPPAATHRRSARALRVRGPGARNDPRATDGADRGAQETRGERGDRRAARAERARDRRPRGAGSVRRCESRPRRARSSSPRRRPARLEGRRRPLPEGDLLSDPG